MSYLIIAVLCSVSVSILLKILRQRQIDIRQTIMAGYPVAFALTWLLLKPDLSPLYLSATTQAAATSSPAASVTLGSAWGIIITLGVLLPLVFILLGRSIAQSGIIMTDAAQRLSLIIPITAAFLLFGDVLTPQRSIGILLGFLALGALLYQPQHTSHSHIDTAIPTTSAPATLTRPTAATKAAPLLLLLGVWVGYGVIDILFKQVAKQGTAFPLTLFLSFGLAGLLLLVYLIEQRMRQRLTWQPTALWAGLILGALNMGNIYAYIKAHQVLHDSPSIVFTGMNVGVIAVATLVGVMAFHERLNRINVLGLVLAVACVLLLFLG